MGKSFLLKLLFVITIANFAAQIPYYIHQYYLPYHAAPSAIGLLLITAVLAWFLVGYYGLVRKLKLGYMLTLGFLAVEFLFYLQTQIVQFLSGHGVLLYVLHPHGWLLFGVFSIGYINFFSSAWFIFHLLTHKSQYLGYKS